ncbi:MAG TPA: hypothetical protein HA354_05890 [Candidatus Poseidoniaceae archaeon]|mgnify:FL=1|nr:MAG TPA: hypothetical protein D7I07_05870 [Candidatus Poseidoniales archaeon]HII38010.1 hypothetical protein [Candidatus Poseidoniaceae archaeon]|tara:strand:- start:82 stop:564 length:483 start_codon:yes stop_codon:yes gene_type:complete
MADKNKPSSKVVLIGLFFPVFLVIAVDISMNGQIPNFGIDEWNPRVANSALTAFILCTTFLLGNMFFYGESRKRPLAPIFGMVIAVIVGISATVFFINQGPMLLEGNGSVRAQLVYNISHTIISIIALVFSLMITLGVLFSTITHSDSKIKKLYNRLEEE